MTNTLCVDIKILTTAVLKMGTSHIIAVQLVNAKKKIVNACLPLCGRNGERVVVSCNYRLGKKVGFCCVHIGFLDGTRFSEILKIGGNV